MQSQIFKKYVARNVSGASNIAKQSLMMAQRTQAYSQFYTNYGQNDNQKQSSRFNNFYLLLGTATLAGYVGKSLFDSKVSEAEGADSSNNIDVEIDFAGELKDGEMKELKVGPQDEDKVLISRYQGKLYAVGNYCSHFGAPMSTGLMFDDKVLCPWHAAAFSVKTGAIENAPGMDNLPKFDIIEKDGKHFVTVPLVLPRKHSMELAKRDPNDKRRYVIIGGGPAGHNCAEALRQSNYTGEITVISAEDISAYDRTLLTKVLPTGDATKFKLRSDEFLKNADIDYVFSTRADSVDSNAKTVKLSNGETIHYDKLCIATGTSPFRPRVQGIDYKNVFVLRSHNDQEQIKKLTANAKKVVILGSGFIGSESASALKLQFKDAMEVSIVSMEAVPFQRQFGTEVGKMFLSEHEKNGVKMYMQKKLKEFRGEGDLAKTVVLEDGTEIEADLVLVATGVLPATKFLEGSGIQLDKWGGILCDPFLQTSAKDVFAAGDCASYPYWATGQRMRIEHYMTAMDQGSYSAFNMLGKMVPFGNVPFFWTRNYNKAVQYIGYSSDFEEVYIQGDVMANKFLAFYIKNGKIQAIAGQQMNHAILTYMEAMYQNQLPSAEDVKSGKETVDTIKAKLKQNKGASRCRRENCCHKKPIVA